MLWSLLIDIESGGDGEGSLDKFALSSHDPATPVRRSHRSPNDIFTKGADRSHSATGPINVRGNLRRCIHIRSLPYTLNMSEQELKILLNFASHTFTVVPLLHRQLMMKSRNVKDIIDQVLLQSRADKFRSFVRSIFRTDDLQALGDINEKRLRDLYESVLTSLHLLTTEAERQLELLLQWYDCSGRKVTTSADFEQKSFNVFFKSKVIEKGPVVLKVSVNTCSQLT